MRSHRGGLPRRGIPASLLLALAACTGPDADYDLSPIARESLHPESRIRDARYAGPIVPDVASPSASTWGVRPLFLTTNRPWQDGASGERERMTSFIPPFGKYHSNPRTTQFRFWPLFWWTRERTVNGGVDLDWMLFPLLFYGSTQPTEADVAAGDREGWYAALFPVLGQIDTFVGYDRFQFLLWPVLQRLTKRVYDQEENFTSLALLIGWTTGYPRGGSHHVLPLYFKSVWSYPPHRAPKYPEGADPSQPLPKYDKRCYLWPFVHVQTLHMDRGPGKETHVLAVWPLFRREKSFDHEFWTILWPFFRWRIEVPQERGNLPDAQTASPEPADDGAPAEAEDGDDENVLIHFLTQAVWKYEKTREYVRRRLLIFLYADYSTLPEDKANRIDSVAILQPIGFWKRDVQELQPEVGGHRDRTYWILAPFFQTHHRTLLDGSGAPDGRTGRFTKLWPLVSYERDDAADTTDFHTLSLLPLRLEKYVKDFNDAWGFFWNVYHYRREGTATRHQALFELVEVYHDDVESMVSIPLLYTYRSVPDGANRMTTHNLLWGMFGWEQSEGPTADATHLKLFFVPIPLG